MKHSTYHICHCLFLASIFVTTCNSEDTGTTVLPFVDEETVKREITLGVFVGNEKYVYDDVTYNFCSRAIFQPSGVGSNKFLTWLSNEGTCEKAGVDQVTGKISGDWFGQIVLEEIYAETVDSNECLSESKCNMFDINTSNNAGDVTFDKDYDVKAVSCGRNHKNDLTGKNGTKLDFYCDAWQLTLLKRKSTGPQSHQKYGKRYKKSKKSKKEKEEKDNDMPEDLLVLTITYGDAFHSLENPNCPETVAYNNQTLGTPNMRGAAQLVLQGNITKGLDPCKWDCFKGNSEIACVE